MGLSNVWVCGEEVQLVRADHIVSVLVSSSYGTSEWDSLKGPCALKLDLGPVGEYRYQVTVGHCPAPIALAAVGNLLQAIDEAADSRARTFVWANTTEEGVAWEVSPVLPSDTWPVTGS
jgi:hypothetical protein